MAQSKAQLDNLKPFDSNQNREKAKKNGRKGGKASGEAKRKKKLLKDCLDELLQKEWENRQGEKMSGSEAISVAVFKKALAGDMKAFEIVRDTSGQGVVQKVMVAEVEQSMIDEVERMVLDEGDEKDAGDVEKH